MGWPMIAPMLAAGAAGLLCLHLASVALVLWRLRPGRAGLAPAAQAPGAPAQRPFVSVLRPVCGREPFDAETLASSFRQDWPDYEVMFCVARADDPVVPLVRALIAAHPGRPARLLVGDDRISRNPKLNNLVKGWAAAAGDPVVMVDSNVLMPDDFLATVMGCWAPGVGLVSAPPAGVRPEGLWARVECAFLNANQARVQLAVDALGFGFAQGKVLAWRRAVLEAAGGPAALAAELAEDAAATKLVRRAGLAVRLMPRPARQPLGRRGLGEVWRRQLRWSQLRRESFPAIFLLEPLNGPVVPLGLLVAAAMAGLPWALVGAFVLLWYGAEHLLARAAGWPAGPADLAALPLRDAMLPVLWLASFRPTRYDWRGNRVEPAQAAGPEGAVAPGSAPLALPD